MATYYVRTDGSDTNAGTGAGTGSAWKTIGKALGSAGIASGDTVWIAPGKYRESITVNMTSATAETFVKGDPTASQFSGVSAGEIILTSYTTDDNTHPTTTVVNMNGRDYLSFSDITFLSYDNAFGACINAGTATSTNCKFTRCAFISNLGNMRFDNTFNVALNLTLDRCVFFSMGNCVKVNNARGTGSNYSTGISIKSCIFMSIADYGYNQASTGTGTSYGVGGDIYNCVFLGQRGMVLNQGGVTATTFNIRNTIFHNQLEAMWASASGEISEDYNRLVSGSRTNVTAGSNSKVSAPAIDLGMNWAQGIKTRLFGYPHIANSIIASGTSSGAPTLDFYGNTFAGTPSIGAVEDVTISTSGGGLIVHPGMTGGIRG